MPKKPAFYFNSERCTGCKTCMIACIDKHDLPLGVMWRRVLEYSGGAWEKKDGAFQQNVFAYYVSLSCNHCEDPACTNACPTKAMHKGDDGIVVVDQTRCIGCRYCEWTCPYGAPQFNPELKKMTKCDMCKDNLAKGEAPACVAACPTRALEFGDYDELVARYGEQAAIAPCPLQQSPSLTLFVHPTAILGRRAAMKVCVEPVSATLRRYNMESPWSLIFFTLLGQSAAGLAVYLAFAHKGKLLKAGKWLAMILLALAALCSLGHLYSPEISYLSITNVMVSPLSREILCLGLFGFSLLLWPILGTDILRWLAAALGVVFMLAMSHIYMIPTVPMWNTIMTPLAFVATGFMLGAAWMGILCIFFAHKPETPNQKSGNRFFSTIITIVAVIACIAIAVLRPVGAEPVMFKYAEIGLLALGALTLLLLRSKMTPKIDASGEVLQSTGGAIYALILFLFLWAGAICGRAIFYANYTGFGM